MERQILPRVHYTLSLATFGMLITLVHTKGISHLDKLPSSIILDLNNLRLLELEMASL